MKSCRKDGKRARSGGRINRASDAFVKAFTKVYPKLAEQAPVYAQLRNCIDLAVAAAFIQNQDYYDLVKWTPAAFASEQQYPVETLNPPQQVESAVNALWKGNTARHANRRRRADAADRGGRPDQPARRRRRESERSPRGDRSLEARAGSMVVGLTSRHRYNA